MLRNARIVGTDVRIGAVILEEVNANLRKTGSHLLKFQIGMMSPLVGPIRDVLMIASLSPPHEANAQR